MAGDGGELTAEGGDGAAAGEVVLEEDGASDREGVVAFGGAAEALGDAAGDCATAENAHIATSIRTKQERAILRGRERNGKANERSNI